MVTLLIQIALGYIVIEAVLLASKLAMLDGTEAILFTLFDAQLYQKCCIAIEENVGEEITRIMQEKQKVIEQQKGIKDADK